ncbi:MAG: type II secretion system secretin GspD [Aquificae bacterium]|nr:type II secretion system secretin GspD [Aquificota bacterium]
MSRLIINFVIILAISFFSYSVEKTDTDFQQLLAQAKLFKKTGKVTLNFEKIDIKLLTYFMGELADKNIILDPKIRGEVSLIFSKPISIQDAWAVFSSILKSKNYTMIDYGSYIQIIPESASKKATPPFSKDDAKEDKLITYVYELKHAEITHVLNVLKGLKSPRGTVLSYNPANTIIITDYATTIDVLKNVLSFIDTKDASLSMKIYTLKYADANEVASALNVAFSDVSKKGIIFKTHALKSQNALLVKTQEKIFPLIESLIKTLDVETEKVTIRTFWIVHLKNTKAEDLANVLNKLLENIQLINFDDTSKTSTSSKKKRKTSTDLLRRLYTKRKTSTIERPKIIAEKTTNTLIIYANKDEYEQIKKIIDELDQRKKQILVSALITEVSEQALKEIGVRWQILGTQGGAAFRGGIAKQDFFSTLKSAGFIAGVLSSAGTNINIGGTDFFFPDLVFILSLLQKGSGFNVISSPKILTMDNLEAQINVAQVVPFAESTKFDINGNPIITFDYKEVGLKLKVTPHISGNNVILELHQEINEVVSLEKLQLGQITYQIPTTTKREIDTTITVENGKTVILGGLISKKTIQSMEGIPLISKIPIVGRLFRYNSDEFNKTNLFVFITPFIIESPEQLAKITEELQKISTKLIKEVEKKRKVKFEKIEKKDIFEDYRKYFGG